jgi:ribosomal protein L32
MKKKQGLPRCPNCGRVRLSDLVCSVCKKELCLSCAYVRYFRDYPSFRCEACAQQAAGYEKLER